MYLMDAHHPIYVIMFNEYIILGIKLSLIVLLGYMKTVIETVQLNENYIVPEQYKIIDTILVNKCKI